MEEPDKLATRALSYSNVRVLSVYTPCIELTFIFLFSRDRSPSSSVAADWLCCPDVTGDRTGSNGIPALLFLVVLSTSSSCYSWFTY